MTEEKNQTALMIALFGIILFAEPAIDALFYMFLF